MLKKALLAVVLLPLFLSLNFVIAASKDDLIGKFSEAQSLEKQGKISQAIEVYQSLISSNPLLPEAYNNLAALHLKQKNIKQAKYVLEQGLHAHKGYGVLYESLTAINVAMAREAYSKALQIDLKPSDISIASLSLTKGSGGNKINTIVINKNTENNSISIVPPKENIVEKELTGTIERGSSIPSSLEKVLNAWSVAWSAQAVDIYLSFYHEQYKPTNGMSRRGWAQSRRYRLKKPNWIKVKLTGFDVINSTEKKAVVNFKQFYQSNKFRDESSKQMVLLYTDNGWKIFREKSI